MHKLSFEEKQRLKSELLEAATKGVRDMLVGIRGAQYFGSNVGVSPYDKLTEITVHSEPRPTYFEIIVRERRK